MLVVPPGWWHQLSFEDRVLSISAQRLVTEKTTRVRDGMKGGFMGKPWKNHGKRHGKWKNHGKTMEKAMKNEKKVILLGNKGTSLGICLGNHLEDLIFEIRL